MKRPVLQGEIVGRRAWVLRVRDGRLRGVGYGSEVAWRPGVNQAACLVHRHRAPHHNCNCGLYAFYDASMVLLHCVRGLVSAWGDVEAHVDGFRAQYARIAALVDDPGTAPIHALARVYGVPVITPEQFADDAFIAEFGEVLPPELRVALAPSRWQRVWRDWWSIILVGQLAAMFLVSVGMRTEWPYVGGLMLFLLALLSDHRGRWRE